MNGVCVLYLLHVVVEEGVEHAGGRQRPLREGLQQHVPQPLEALQPPLPLAPTGLLLLVPALACRLPAKHIGATLDPHVQVSCVGLGSY